MAFVPTSPVTGAAVTGLTSPTYTLTSDVSPVPNGKQYVVSALGGTQSDAVAHSASSPFTVSFVKPLVVKMFDFLRNTRSNQTNTYKLLVRKGVRTAQEGSTYRDSVARIEIAVIVPVGADALSQADLKAMLSCAGGVLHDQAGEIYDSVIAGSL
jgi:hypothetical protein